ncbi:uncharacterized protein MYCGRDRAFT_103042 [Zymoseptoria tritici IPO323]|uniref:Uncharacterized protein n=1 Tax=Zymoseptoria tritici (strain CBS 115943 / IPO323) TaxID=336722 RepID=F9X3E0_ZYMTI|nr:uncharacterized protein MYCGRDRAFT_103042 [Zymoseptoria tritici IPO323]EGP90733.1 hypothetical protein MYCGRDRAFT_103042 [Zymoseptoria tritici IPO323]
MLPGGGLGTSMTVAMKFNIAVWEGAEIRVKNLGDAKMPPCLRSNCTARRAPGWPGVRNISRRTAVALRRPRRSPVILRFGAHSQVSDMTVGRLDSSIAERDREDPTREIPLDLRAW